MTAGRDVLGSTSMRIVRASRWPRPPLWAVGIMGVYLGLIGISVLLGRSANQDFILCRFRWLTSYPCPACGTTRMVLSVLEGKPGAAFLHNPLMAVLGLGVLTLLLVRLFTRRKLVWITKQQDVTRWTIVFMIALLANWCYVLYHHDAF
jgi:hypothetical protein